MAGPVRVTLKRNGSQEPLGEAPTLVAAMDRWPELREVGDAVECTWTGGRDLLTKYLSSSLVIAPPEGWEGKTAYSGFELRVNDRSIDALELVDLDWQPSASIGHDYGGTSLGYRGGWFRDCQTDLEDFIWWSGLAPDLSAEGRAFVLSAQLPPGDGSYVSVTVNHLGASEREAFIAELLSSELTDVFESIELDDVVVWERDTV